MSYFDNENEEEKPSQWVNWIKLRNDPPPPPSPPEPEAELVETGEPFEVDTSKAMEKITDDIKKIQLFDELGMTGAANKLRHRAKQRKQIQTSLTEVQRMIAKGYKLITPQEISKQYGTWRIPNSEAKGLMFTCYFMSGAVALGGGIVNGMSGIIVGSVLFVAASFFLPFAVTRKTYDVKLSELEDTDIPSHVLSSIESLRKVGGTFDIKVWIKKKKRLLTFRRHHDYDYTTEQQWYEVCRWTQK